MLLIPKPSSREHMCKGAPPKKDLDNIASSFACSNSSHVPLVPLIMSSKSSHMAGHVLLGRKRCGWRLVHHDDFEASAEGWSLLETSSCNGMDRFLSGHCNIGAGQVTKRFEGG